MQIKFLRLPLASLAFLLLLNLGCTKIDTTELGADLIPAVDNVHTFADTLDIIGSNEPNTDTTRLFNTENHILGSINNDPVFGKTKADIFLQLKPDFFPFYFGSAGDTIKPAYNTKFDSVFLCLSYKGFYGDSTIAQNLSVYTLDPNTANFKNDSTYRLDFQPDIQYSNRIGQITVKPGDINKQVFFRYGKDSVTNQIRIKLDESFLTTITSFDSSTSGQSNAFRSDSLFKVLFKGFAVVSETGSPGNGLFYISLTDPLTRLEVHYTKRNGKLDTSYSALSFSQGTSSAVSTSAHANYVQRDATGSESITSPQADALYVQSTPGTAIRLEIPELTGYSNRIIHRAEIFLEQVPGDPALDKALTPPAFLYLDLIDDTATPRKYKPVYYDLSPNTFYNPDDKASFFPSGGVDHNYFGGFQRTMTDGNGTRSYYTFNLTRYVQNIVTRGGVNYKLRVTAPYNLTYYGLSLNYSNKLAFGRVKLGNGNNPNHKLRMRIVYSNL